MPHAQASRITLLTVVNVSPGIVGLDGVTRAVEYSESVDDVRTEISVDILGKEFTLALPVPSPVGEVAHDLVLVVFVLLQIG